jgi:hypothetical protein
MIEFIVKIIEAAAKYAWGVLAVCLFVLFLPHKQACSTGIATLKDQISAIGG